MDSSRTSSEERSGDPQRKRSRDPEEALEVPSLIKKQKESPENSIYETEIQERMLKHADSLNETALLRTALDKARHDTGHIKSNFDRLLYGLEILPVANEAEYEQKVRDMQTIKAYMPKVYKAAGLGIDGSYRAMAHLSTDLYRRVSALCESEKNIIPLTQLQRKLNRFLQNRGLATHANTASVEAMFSALERQAASKDKRESLLLEIIHMMGLPASVADANTADEKARFRRPIKNAASTLRVLQFLFNGLGLEFPDGDLNEFQLQQLINKFFSSRQFFDPREGRFLSVAEGNNVEIQKRELRSSAQHWKIQYEEQVRILRNIQESVNTLKQAKTDATLYRERYEKARSDLLSESDELGTTRESLKQTLEELANARNELSASTNVVRDKEILLLREERIAQESRATAEAAQKAYESEVFKCAEWQARHQQDTTELRETQQKTNELQTQLDDVKITLSEKGAELWKSKNQIDDLEKALGEEVKKAEEFKHAAEKSEKFIRHNQLEQSTSEEYAAEENKKLQAHNEKLTATLKEERKVSSRFFELQARCDELDKDAATHRGLLQQETRRRERDLSDLQKEKEAIKKRHNNEKYDYEEKISDLHSELKKYKAKIEECEGQAEERKRAVEKLIQPFAQHREQTSLLTEEVMDLLALQEALAQKTEDFERVQQELKDAQEQLAELKESSSEQLQAKITDHSSEVEHMQRDLQKTRNELSNAQANLSKKVEQLSIAEASVQRPTQAADRLEASKRLENTKTKRQSELTERDRMLEARTATLWEQIQVGEKLKKEVESLEKKFIVLAIIVGHQEIESEASKSTVGGLKHIIQEKQLELQDHQAKMDGSRLTIADLERTIKEKSRELSNQQSEIDAVNGKLQKALSDAESSSNESESTIKYLQDMIATKSHKLLDQQSQIIQLKSELRQALDGVNDYKIALDSVVESLDERQVNIVALEDEIRDNEHKPLDRESEIKRVKEKLQIALNDANGYKAALDAVEKSTEVLQQLEKGYQKALGSESAHRASTDRSVQTTQVEASEQSAQTMEIFADHSATLPASLFESLESFGYGPIRDHSSSLLSESNAWTIEVSKARSSWFSDHCWVLSMLFWSMLNAFWSIGDPEGRVCGEDAAKALVDYNDSEADSNLGQRQPAANKLINFLHDHSETLKVLLVILAALMILSFAMLRDVFGFQLADAAIEAGGDFGRVVQISLRQGGGSGLKWPTWMWDDPLLPPIAGLYSE